MRKSRLTTDFYEFGGKSPLYGRNFTYEPEKFKGKHVLLFFGGKSTEHLVSCRSALFIARTLSKMPLKLSLVGITVNGDFLPYPFDGEHLDSENWVKEAEEYGKSRNVPSAPISSPAAFLSSLTKDGSKPDILFPVLHGINCEDGAIQGLFKMADIPFVGSGILASACGMDKIAAKTILQHYKIPVVPWFRLSRRVWQMNNEDACIDILEKLPFPLFVKPANGGSSVGAGKANNLSSLNQAIAAAAELDSEILIERQLRVRELECGVLGNFPNYLASPVGEIIVKKPNSFYDYQTKYFSEQGTETCIPATITTLMTRQIHELALEVCNILQISGLARVDFFFDRDARKIYFNEINTMPGFTEISLYPQVFAAGGFDATELCGRLLYLALAEHEERSRRETI